MMSYRFFLERAKPVIPTFVKKVKIPILITDIDIGSFVIATIRWQAL
jgi:hypothetical protein